MSSTPKHSRQSSNNIDSFSKSHSRTHSRISGYSPCTPSRIVAGTNQLDHNSPETFHSGNLSITQTNGSGNLADELADAWDEDEDEDEDQEEDDEIRKERSGYDLNTQQQKELNPSRDSGVDVSTLPFKNSRASIQSQVSGREYRKFSSDYDGSEYGDNSTLEIDDTPAGLLAKMDLVESLVRRGTENNGSDRDGIVKRVIEGLRDLGGQSKIEGGTTRLITAHSALSTHILHQTRVLQSLAYPLFSPLAIPLDEELINELMPILIKTSESIPRPSMAAFNSLAKLHSLTTDLIQNLNCLSDTLHMSRQTTTTASRRLRSARELVAEMRKEEEARIEGESWLKLHNWPDRLHNRECARVCGDVLDGFDEVCNGWRARLIAQAEIVGA
ncbi:hypothetical protein GcM3_173015 [Golovinomyces cichoracearum]|uniref:Uncharacterized protein n=1 Tax=Golovinomyces cichoracearum TaxID=62708 RepID=A0A420HQ71_9PEZI|nr:hypothetical protein GcM3_173015 [Golovinomyces cichoracearum]